MNNIKLILFFLSKKSFECLKIISFFYVLVIISIIFIISYSSFFVIIDSMYSVIFWKKKIKNLIIYCLLFFLYEW